MSTGSDSSLLVVSASVQPSIDSVSEAKIETVFKYNIFI